MPTDCSALVITALQVLHVLQAKVLQATCSAKGKWNVKAAHAAHVEQGGGISIVSFQLTAGRLRDRQ
jgi:hypothetical protein